MLEKLDGELFQPLCDEESMNVLGGGTHDSFVGLTNFDGTLVNDWSNEI